MKEMVGGCCVCSDERGWPDNPLVYCDGNGCTVAVHQACYGIVTVPTGPWYCRKCECSDTKPRVRCELCPSKSGALKRADSGGWAHVVCALYIPEVRFGNVTSMEPIVLRLIPPERYNKTCYICSEQGKTSRANAGACMQCNKSGCKQQFHVTCAQGLGLLCEEAGNYLDNVKYCGYCQHHYSKLKKGGNVKTIPPYKPVSQDSQSSDSSCEKDGEAPSMPSGSVTPTHAGKSKGPGRKSSHASSTVVSGSGKSTATSKTAANQPSGSKMHQPADKKKPSPRRGSSTDGSGSKSNTPAPSPQHATTHTETSQTQTMSTRAAGSSTPSTSKATPLMASPSANKPAENVGVISSVASAIAATNATITSASLSVTASTSVVQVPAPKPTYQESVITNVENMEMKQTKKRKAVNAANLAAAAEFLSSKLPPPLTEPPPAHSGAWEGGHQHPPDVQAETSDKIKKAKTDNLSTLVPPVPTSHFSSVSPAPPPPPPPPAHSPASHRSPRNLTSPRPGPSGLHQMSYIRSPSHLQGKAEREGHASLLVSVPLPSSSHGLNLTAHSQMAAHNDIPGQHAQHLFHQAQKQAAMDTGFSGHSQHPIPSRTWAGLNIAYEMQQEPNKPGMSGMASTSKEMAGPSINIMPPVTIRNKKRAAMNAIAAMANNASAMQTTTTQSLATIRRPPQPPPPSIYQETIKDSPPSSPSSERPLKPKRESSKMPAPHMLGNELNPESGAAACLQEQLTAELAAHAAGTSGADAIIPPPLMNKAAAGGSGSGRGSSGAQSLDQLLERQWEQGSQFLMEQAQHFDMIHRTYRRAFGVAPENTSLQWDVASLLSCLHQLRTENVRLEDHVGNLQLRRDHLLAVNARLAIPLNTDITAMTGQMLPPETTSRSQMHRDNGGSMMIRPPPPPVRAAETITSERSHQQLIMREVQQKPS